MPKHKSSRTTAGEKPKRYRADELLNFSVAKYPCTVCSEDCFTNSIGCDGCQSWTHDYCINVNVTDFEVEETTFYCPKCVLIDGQYNLEAALGR